MCDIKFMKKSIVWVVLIIGLYSQANAGVVVPCGEQSGDTSSNCWKCGDTCYARLDSSGKLMVQGSGNMYNNRWTGSTFETIWQDKNKDIKSVYIDEGITSIGMASFWNTNVSYVYIPTTIETIGWGAFEDAKKLKSITLPESLTSTTENIVKNSGVDTIYCTNAQRSSGGVCSQSKLNQYQFKGEVLRYEKENDYYVFYDKDGNIDKRYNWEKTIEYDAKGNMIAKYDVDGNMLKAYNYGADGSVSVYDKEGNLVSKTGKHFSMEELSQILKNDNSNTVSITW